MDPSDIDIWDFCPPSFRPFPKSFQQTHLSHNQNPELKWSTQNHVKNFKKAAAAFYGWDCPLLTFIHLGFGCGSPWDSPASQATPASFWCPLGSLLVKRGSPWCKKRLHHTIQFEAENFNLSSHHLRLVTVAFLVAIGTCCQCTQDARVITHTHMHRLKQTPGSRPTVDPLSQFQRPTLGA